MKKSAVKLMLAVSLGFLAGQFAGTRVSDQQFSESTSYKPGGVQPEKYFNRKPAIITGLITSVLVFAILHLPQYRQRRKKKQQQM
jgi:hypothetical protein